MDPIFFEQKFYIKHKIIPKGLRKKIQDKYQGYDFDKEYTFEELLFILDEHCQFNRCDRDVARQLFEQSSTPQNKASLNQMIFKYTENLQTSRLCLMRENQGISQIKEKLSKLKGSKNCYVHLKIIQVEAYARYSSVPSLSYKISPSDIPPVTVVNTMNPEFNHEYTLQILKNQFEIIFYESGLQIGRWRWPDQQYFQHGQMQYDHYRNITLQNLGFQLKLKYIPKNSDPKSIPLNQQLNQRTIRQNNEKQAFRRLCYFQPFLERDEVHKEIEPDHGKVWIFTQKIIECLPFLGEHVRNLYYCLILMLLIEALVSVFWSMEFLDIMISFYLISTLYDQSEYDLGMEFWGSMMAIFLLIVKSIWGISASLEQGKYFIQLMIFAIFVKFCCIFFIWISAIRKQQIPEQKFEYFYSGVDPKFFKHQPEAIEKEQIQIFIDA